MEDPSNSKGGLTGYNAGIVLSPFLKTFFFYYYYIFIIDE